MSAFHPPPPGTPASHHAGRLQWGAALVAGLLLLSSVLRAVLYASFHDGPFAPGTFAMVMAAGPVYDLLALTIALTPCWIALALFRLRLLERVRVRAAVFTVVFGVYAFLLAVEYFFFLEFNARFNHIALDYVRHPDEVFGNIWESYNVPLVVASCLAVGALAAWPAMRKTRGVRFERVPVGGRLRALAAGAAAVIVAVGAVGVAPASIVADRVTSEIAENGLAQLVRAFVTSDLPYEEYYATIPKAEARARAAAFLGFPAPRRVDAPDEQFELERTVDPAAPSKGWDVVVILGESFGSEFIGVLGHPERRTSPGFDRWSHEGLLLTHLVPTGNRTVRGLEGTLSSFVPLPPDSILKRGSSDHVATLGRVFKDAGYATAFFYGGWGRFDAMKPFFPDNGFDEFFERDAFPRDAFHTIWGVADEFVFTKLLERQEAAHARGERLFAAALTVSNHRPFDVPERGTAWPATKRNREAAVAYADWAIADYLDRAKAKGLLDHTIVLILGDHGARIYGSGTIPTASYRVPALFVVPGDAWRGKRIDRLASQIDLAPTLLSLAGVSATTPFLGSDLTKLPAAGGRAFVQHNRDIGLMTDRYLVVLGLQKKESVFEREGPDSDTFVAVDPARETREERELTRDAEAVYEVAYEEYVNGRYR